MEVLFVTGLYTKDSEYYYSSVLKNGVLANPSNVYQWGIVKGLVANEVGLEVASFPFLPTYPHGVNIRKTITEDIVFKNRKIGSAYSYSTIAGFKEIDIIYKLKRVIKKWVNNIADSELAVILIYSLYGPFLKAACDVAKNHKNVKVCPIVTDLFIHSISVLKTYPFLKKIQGFFEYRMIKYGLKMADTFVLLAKGMEKYVPRAINNNVVVEGIGGDHFPRPIFKEDTHIKTLLYTGSLGVHTSIKELVQAFMLTTNDSFRLKICGSGVYADYIKEMSEKDNRIIFCGSVSRDEAVSLQKEATVLINPRLPSVPDTPFSFPSKTIEYLASGTPMIGYKLIGIPEEYYKYFYIPEDESIEALTRLISDVLLLPSSKLYQRAMESWTFIVTQKTAVRQIKKMIEFLETLKS